MTPLLSLEQRAIFNALTARSTAKGGNGQTVFYEALYMSSTFVQYQIDAAEAFLTLFVI